MGKPTDKEMMMALKEAARMREEGDDPNFLAKAFFSVNYRLHKLEKVMAAAEHYLHSGQAVHEHSKLIRALEEGHQVEASSGTRDESIGLASN